GFVAGVGDGNSQCRSQPAAQHGARRKQIELAHGEAAPKSEKSPPSPSTEAAFHSKCPTPPKCHAKFDWRQAPYLRRSLARFPTRDGNAASDAKPREAPH